MQAFCSVAFLMICAQLSLLVVYCPWDSFVYALLELLKSCCIACNIVHVPAI